MTVSDLLELAQALHERGTPGTFPVLLVDDEAARPAGQEPFTIVEGGKLPERYAGRPGLFLTIKRLEPEAPRVVQ